MAGKAGRTGGREKAVLAHFMAKPSEKLAAKAAIAALLQDAANDATSGRCIPAGAKCGGKIVAKSDFTLCGIVEANAAFGHRGVRAKWNFREGQAVKKGRAICEVSGNARSILACERTALNFLSLLSGIATKARRAADKHGRRRIAATRKTLPLLAHSEKRAVMLGGCLTHRLSLSDGILVKDNHIAAIMAERKVTPARAVEIACGAFSFGQFTEVEVSSVETAVAAALSGAGAILADNVSPAKLWRIAKAARKASPGIIIEASGGITLENAGKYLRAGADFCSTSSLTMEIEPADLSLELG